MNASDRLMQYLDAKGISRAAFYKATGLANGYLDKRPNIGADKIERILSVYPDISLVWLVRGVGEMFYNSEQDHSQVDKTLKPVEIISKLVTQNDALIAIIHRHSLVIERLSTRFEEA